MYERQLQTMMQSQPTEGVGLDSLLTENAPERIALSPAGNSTQDEVKRRFGILPNFFGLARGNPEITANLWGFACFAYLDNPLPSLFKERLFVYLSRFCDVRYCIARHMGFLVGLGRASGDARCAPQSVEEVIRLIRRPFPRGADLEPFLSRCAACDSPQSELPVPDSPMEQAIFACASHAFVQTPDAPKCVDALRHVLGESRFQHMLVFLAFIRTAHYWTKVHGELTIEADIKELLATHESLAQCLLNDPEAGAIDVSQKLMNEMTTLRREAAHHDELLRSQQRHSEERLRLAHAELGQQRSQLEQAQVEIHDSRRAALNLKNDAVQAREAQEKSSAELRASDEFNHSLMESSADCVKVLDLEGRLLMMNGPGMCLMEIDDLAPFFGREWPSFWPEESRTALAEAVRRARNGETASYFGFCPTAKGTPRWWDVKVSPVRDSAGAIVRLLVVSRDLTEHKQAEENARESEMRFRRMADAAPVLIWISDTTKACTWFNKWWLDFTGRSMEQLANSGWADGVHADDLDRCLHIYNTHFDARKPFSMDYRLRRNDGEYRWVLDNGLPRFDSDGKFAGYVGSCIDITERHQIEEKLRESEQETKRARDYAEATLRSSPVPLLVLEKDLRVSRANEAFYEIFHVERKTTEGRLVTELGNGQWNIPKLRELLEDILPNRSWFNGFEVTHDFESIGRRTMLINARRMENEPDASERIVVVIEDITERKQSEEALRESEERFRMMADNIFQLAWTCDQLGNVTWYNRRWLDYTGLTFDEMKDWGWTKCHHPDHVDRVVKSVTHSRETGEVWEDTFPLRGKDGEYRWFLSRAVPIRDAQGNIVRWFGTNTDITKQRADEEALRHSHELLTDEAAHLETLVQERTARLQETITELEHFSYTITHDMRAPLRAMQGFGGLLLEDSDNRLSPKSADFLRRIMNSARRMDALIGDSLQYAKVIRERLPLGPVQPAPILRGILESYSTLQPPKVKIEIVEPFPPVIANEAGLAQCFSNLLVNAVKFVKPGVTPAIRVWAEDAASSSSAKFIRFCFEDNGIGIPQEYQERIFGMFQQLDKSYDGTGIGLALVRKTAERMGGKVGVQSEPGKGSRFWLQFQSGAP
jgi:PAS domain S-box-containing protein